MYLGDRYQSYAKLESIFREYRCRTKTRYYKRDCRTIQYKFDAPVLIINPKLVYAKIKYVCVHSSDGKVIKLQERLRKRASIKQRECPAYFFFRATSCGMFLELVAMNTNHNHNLTYMSKKKRGENIDASFSIINVENVEDSDCLVEDDLEMGGNNEIEYIRVTCDEELNLDNPENCNLDSFVDESEENVVFKESDLKTHFQTTSVSFDYSGVLAPVFTPFKNDGKMALNMDVVPNYIEFLHDKGIRGVLVNGTSGEGTSMSVCERKIVAEKWITCAKDYGMHVMIQVGGAPLPDVLELASHAEKFGANSLLCLPELYIKPTTNSQLINYLKLVSQAAPKTPLLYYHIPMFSNVSLHMGKFLNEIKNDIPTFSGIKFTSSALDEAVDAVKARGGSFEIFLGNDKLMLGAYVLGLKSCIATTLNIFPQLGINIQQYAMNDECIVAAKEAQDDLTAIVDIISKYGDWVSTMKEAMNLLTPIYCGPVRNPLPGISTADAKEMSKLLFNYKKLL